MHYFPEFFQFNLGGGRTKPKPVEKSSNPHSSKQRISSHDTSGESLKSFNFEFGKDATDTNANPDEESFSQQCEYIIHDDSDTDSLVKAIGSEFPDSCTEDSFQGLYFSNDNNNKKYFSVKDQRKEFIQSVKSNDTDKVQSLLNENVLDLTQIGALYTIKEARKAAKERTLDNIILILDNHLQTNPYPRKSLVAAAKHPDTEILILLLKQDAFNPALFHGVLPALTEALDAARSENQSTNAALLANKLDEYAPSCSSCCTIF